MGTFIVAPQGERLAPIEECILILIIICLIIRRGTIMRYQVFVMKMVLLLD